MDRLTAFGVEELPEEVTRHIAGGVWPVMLLPVAEALVNAIVDRFWS